MHLSDEVAKLLSEYEAEIVKNTDACGKAVANAAAKSCDRPAPKEQANTLKAGA